MKKFYVPTEALAEDVRELSNCVTADILCVHLASEAGPRIAELERAYEANARLSGEVIEDRNKRIAELERDLADAKSLIKSLGRSNDRLRQKLDRARN